MKIRVLAAGAVVALSFVGGPLSAGQCSYDRCFGAIAFNAEKKLTGSSVGHQTKQQAIAAAKRDCGRDCVMHQWFVGACGAVAMTVRGGWGNDWGYTREEAEQKAMNRCRAAENYKKCRIVMSACSY